MYLLSLFKCDLVILFTNVLEDMNHPCWDAFFEYLNKEHDEEYWSLHSACRKRLSRVQVMKLVIVLRLSLRVLQNLLWLPYRKNGLSIVKELARTVVVLLSEVLIHAFTRQLPMSCESAAHRFGGSYAKH